MFLKLVMMNLLWHTVVYETDNTTNAIKIKPSNVSFELKFERYFDLKLHLMDFVDFVDFLEE